MNIWSQRTVELVTSQNYLDRLQHIYPHEDGERSVNDTTIDSITQSFNNRNESELINQLLSLDKFPYKDSYVSFLRKDRAAIARNPETVRRICDRLYSMGLENVISGIRQPKEANTRRGNQFGDWLRRTYRSVPMAEFMASTDGIILLEANELDAKDFCNRHLHVGITKRPDIVAKAGRRYIIGEAKFLSSLGGNQDRAFDDGITLAINADGSAYKIFILDGVLWIEQGSDRYQRIDHSTANIFSVLLLNDFLTSL